MARGAGTYARRVSAVLALLASVLWGTADFLGGTASRRAPVASVLGLSQLTALLGLVPVAVLTHELDADRAYVVPSVAAGLVGMVALGAFYRALATGTMGVVAPVAALGVVVPVAVGLLSGEAPGAGQLFGITLAVAGVVLASGPELRGDGRGGATPLLLALVAAVGFGAVLVLIAEGASSSVVMTLLTMRLSAVLALTALLLVVRRRLGSGLGVGRGALPLVAAVGIGDVLANGAFALASDSAGALVSVTAVLASLYPIVTVLLARQVHGERLRRVQVVGVVGALSGVALLASG